MNFAHHYRATRPRQLWQQVFASVSVFLSLTGLAFAQEEAVTSGWPNVSVHGFGTLGLTRTDTDSAQFVRDLSQPNGAGTQWTSKTDSLLGLQANVQFSPSTEGVVQVVARYHADSSYSPELTWAFLRHDFSPDFSMRVGRLGTEFYMQGDSRLVGYSNISVRPTPDFYGSLVFSYIDGVDASATWPLASGLLKSKIFWGKSPEKTPYYPGILWNLDGTDLTGGYLDYSTGPWQFRLSHVQARFDHEMPVDALLSSQGINLGQPYLSLVPGMAMAGQRTSFDSLGVVYDQGPLNVQVMVNQIRHNSPAYADTRAGYVLAAYRFGSVTPYIGVSRSFSDLESLPSSAVPGVNPLTQSLVAQSITNQHTYTLGGRWDLQKNLALKAQVDWIHGQPESKFPFKTVQSDWDGHMTVFSLALDFVF
jgi:hypothetical protein